MIEPNPLAAAPPEPDHEALRAARARLTALLGEIAELAGERALTRCPYRAADDGCTFGGGCRNRDRGLRGEPHCAGGPLNPGGRWLPASGFRLPAAGNGGPHPPAPSPKSGLSFTHIRMNWKPGSRRTYETPGSTRRVLPDAGPSGGRAVSCRGLHAPGAVAVEALREQGLPLLPRCG